MTDLTALYKDLGFKDVETYIQSGNVIFNSAAELQVRNISLEIESAIYNRLNFNIHVLIRTVEEMRKLVYANPFLNQKNFEPSKMAVIFLYEKSSEAQIQKVINIDYPPDRFKIIGSEIFIYCPNGFGKTRLYTNFFEKKMGVKGTARNWRTINKILEIAEKK